MTVRTMGTMGLSVYLLSLFVTLAGVLIFAKDLADYRESVRHAHDAREIYDWLDGLALSLADCERHQRGYLLTRADFRVPRYQASRERVQASVERLKELTADKPGQAARLAQIEPMVATKLQALADGIELAKHQKWDRVFELIRRIEDMDIVWKVREIISAMQAEEHTRLNQFNEDSDTAAQVAIFTLVGVSVIVSILSLAGVAVFRTEVARVERQYREARQWSGPAT